MPQRPKEERLPGGRILNWARAGVMLSVALPRNRYRGDRVETDGVLGAETSKVGANKSKAGVGFGFVGVGVGDGEGLGVGVGVGVGLGVAEDAVARLSTSMLIAPLPSQVSCKPTTDAFSVEPSTNLSGTKTGTLPIPAVWP